MKCHTDRWVRLIVIFWGIHDMYLYSTRTMESGYWVPSISWGCVTMLWARMWLVAEVLNSELPHLVNEIQTQPLWLKPISTPEWMKLHHFWMYSCHITWEISSRCIVKYLRMVNNIIKAKGVCKMTFGKKSRILWVCQWIIKVLKAILWS